MKQNNIKEIILVIAIVIIQTIIFTIAGINKSYIHMDEAYSLGLASYDKIEIQDNDDFYNTWHNSDYYEDYLAVDEDEKFEFKQVYENQKNDVHPPLYYLILRIAMGLSIGSYSKWTGIIVNIVIYVFITVFMYLIIKKLLDEKNRYKEKSAILALVSSITLAAVTNAIYIRMYALSTLNIAITTYLHLKLLEKKEKNNILLVAIAISALVGSLTHYYYLFYLACMFIMFVIKYVKEKEYKLLGKYVFAMSIAGLLSLAIFPYSINHMFFGYRGQGTIENLTNIPKFFGSIAKYLLITNVYGFNNLLFIVIVASVGIIIYKKIKNKEVFSIKNEYIKYITLPTLFYFTLVAISSPFIELRYIMPICGMMLIIVIYYIASILNNIVKEKTLNIIIVSSILLMAIMPTISNKIIELSTGKEFRAEKEYLYSSKDEFAKKLKSEFKLPVEMFSSFSDASMANTLLYIKNFRIEPEVLYSNKHEIVEILKNDLNVPTLYLFNSNNNRFLDDILLFTNIDESYIAKDVQCNEENIREILQDKDISNGIVVFINDGQENEELINTIAKCINCYEVKYLQRLNACDIYYITNNNSSLR